MVAKFGGFVRGAAAAKTLFTPSSNAQMPGFFVSTPQFNRQKSQVGFYLGEAHRQSFGLDGGSVSVGPSYPFSTSAAVNNDDDDKDIQRTYPNLQFVKSQHPDLTAEQHVAQDNIAVQEIEELDDVVLSEQEQEVAEIKLLASQGRHEEVLEYIDGLENAEKPIPTEAYNMVLASLVEISLKVMDFSPVLEAYQRMVQNMPSPPETYIIVLSGLLRMTKALEQRLEYLQRLLGPVNSDIESIKDVYETVAIADHLKIALSILEAVNIQQHDQELYDNILCMCLKYGIDVSDFTDRCTMQAPRIAAAETYEQAQAVFDTTTATTEDRKAMIDASFKFGNADAGLDLETPQTAEHITMTLADYGYVSTAWKRAQTQKMSFDAECELLEKICSHNIMSTSSLMYNRVVASKKSRAGVWCSGRCAYLRLCARMGDTAMLSKAIKESQYRFAVWDPATILEVTTFLLKEFPQAAVELFVTHSRRLNQLWENNDLKTFSGQELVDAFMARLEGPGPISTFCALILSQSPFVIQSTGVRQKIFEQVWDARLNGSPEYVEFIAEAPEVLVNIVSVHSDYILANESRAGLALPFDIQNSLHKVYPLFVSDIMTNYLTFSKEEAEKIAKSLELLKIKPTPWRQHCASQEFLGNRCTQQDEASISLYASTPNGIDTALEMFERQLLLRKVPSPATLRRIVNELTKANDLQRYEVFRSSVLDRISIFDTSTKVAYHRAFITAASINANYAEASVQALRELSALPCAKGFASLISVSNPCRGMALYTEATANNLKTAEICDATLELLARSDMISDIESILASVGSLKLSTETFRAILDAYLRGDREVLALDLMKMMFSTNSGYERTTEPYDKLLEYYIFGRQDRKAALKIFAYMKRAGVILSPKSYKLLIDTWLLKPMDLRKADLVLETMKLDQAVPDTQHFSSLLRARGILGRDLEGAQAFYRGLVKNSRVFPDQHIFAALMMSYIANGKTGETRKVLDEMAKYHINPEVVKREMQRMA